eukprot:UN14201
MSVRSTEKFLEKFEQEVSAHKSEVFSEHLNLIFSLTETYFLR